MSLKPEAANQTEFEEALEQACLAQAKASPGYQGLLAGRLEDIWRVFVRLAHAGSYPPVVSGANVKWMVEKAGCMDSYFK